MHSSVVAWQCHVLHVHLRQTGSHEVVLPNKRVEDLLSLLYLLYPFHRPTITGKLSLFYVLYRFHRLTVTGNLGPLFAFCPFQGLTITGKRSPFFPR